MVEVNYTFQRTNRMGTPLMQAGLISDADLGRVRAIQAKTGQDLGHTLLSERLITEEKLLKFVAKSLKIPYISVSTYHIDPEAVALLPIAFAQRYHCIPLFALENTLTIAMADPLNILAIDEMRAAVKKEVRTLLASETEIDRAIGHHYGLEDIASGDTHIEFIDATVSNDATPTDLDSGDAERLASGEQIISTVNAILSNAYLEQASDIHIEPTETDVQVRYRIDGVLEEKETLPLSMHFPLISRIKILGGMDIAERRVPQDGRCRIRIREIPIDLRLATYPTTHGEKVAIRFLSSQRLMSLGSLGFSPEEHQHLLRMVERPHGILLVTGPTGSGKTTTLYGALQEIDRVAKNVVSIEDPVENEIAGVNQAGVNVRAGLTFASALRAILRQDPDVIMIGEIRDQETADIAVRAAMTGHLVLSTLHTNTALGAVNRLIDLGVEPFLLSHSILGALAQRLVRRICEHCVTSRTPTDEERLFLESHQRPIPEMTTIGAGCKRCRGSGYSGRIGIFEIVPINSVLRHAIYDQKPEDNLYELFTTDGGVSLLDKALMKVNEKITTLAEIIRVSVN